MVKKIKKIPVPGKKNIDKSPGMGYSHKRSKGAQVYFECLFYLI